MMHAPYQAGPDVDVLPTTVPLPDVGVLPVNAYVLLAEEPVLVDAGMGADAEAFVDALSSIIDPGALPSHLPAANGTSLERFLHVLASVPDAEPAVAPNDEELAQMIAALTEMQPEQPLVAVT